MVSETCARRNEHCSKPFFLLGSARVVSLLFVVIWIFCFEIGTDDGIGDERADDRVFDCPHNWERTHRY